VPATAFAHVVHRGGETFVQYWLYYPDSTTTWGGAAAAWAAVVGRRSYPGFHRDDWEGFQIRIASDGRVLARASSHHGYQYCKGPSRDCAGRWGAWTGWTRVSRGSHAGHVPMVADRVRSGARHGPHRFRFVPRPVRARHDLHERVTTASELRLVPLEPIDPATYRSLDRDGPTPPWLKLVYTDPTSQSTG
jgi:hypothetical protein